MSGDGRWAMCGRPTGEECSTCARANKPCYCDGNGDDSNCWAQNPDECAHQNQHFDRTLCAPPCDTMHYYCDDCGKVTDTCAHEDD